MRLSILIVSVLLASYLDGQSQSAENKPVIDSTAIRNWVSLNDDPVISNDGNYIAYGIGQNEYSRAACDPAYFRKKSLVIQSMSGDWKKQLPGIERGLFSGNNEKFIYLNNETLNILPLGKEGGEIISNIRYFKELPSGKGEWVAWYTNDSAHELILHNLITGQYRKFNSVADYIFNENRCVLVMRIVDRININKVTSLQVLLKLNDDPQTVWTGGTQDSICNYSVDDSGHHLVFVNSSKKDHGYVKSLYWFSLSDVERRGVWNGKPTETISNYTMDASGNRVVFEVSENDDDRKQSKIWYYEAGMELAIEKVSDKTSGINCGLRLVEKSAKFSSDGRYIYFSLEGHDLVKPFEGSVPLDIWNYRDTLLQSVQLFKRNEPEIYYASISINDAKVVVLNKDHELVADVPSKGDYVLVSYDEKGDDRFWIKRKNWFWLVSLKDGTRRTVQIDDKTTAREWFSPEGGYLLYFNKNNYYSVTLNNSETRVISKNISFSWLSFITDESHEISSFGPLGLAGWIGRDSSVLVYDDYDIWRLDLTGRKDAINITGGFGRHHKIKFRIMDAVSDDTRTLADDTFVLLTAFNTINKYNGFYKLKMDGKSTPVLLSMGPWTLNHSGGGNYWALNSHFNDFGSDMLPLKARDKNLWIVRRSSPSEAPNYFFTPDFKMYRPITDFQPQQYYNWLTTELINFKQLDGTTSQGLLFKPENFDCKKRYPVIIFSYQQFSYLLYGFPIPDFSDGEINIPWFVSNGYLVFTPDIHFDRLHLGEKVVNSIAGAAKWLSKLPYVNAKSIGVVGNSQGGAEINYLVTHTHLFAAAIQGSAGHDVDFISNPFSLYNNQNGGNELDRYEYEIGSTLWHRPALWIKHSSIFQADQVTTPLLMFHSKLEGVSFERAVEFFVALRRLGKKVWLLQYDDQEHVLCGKDGEDLTVRYMQFFDYYLKDAPPPKWMTQGVPAKLKGIETGYDLDYSGRQP